MPRVKIFPNSKCIGLFQKLSHKFFSTLGLIALLFTTQASHALAPNPGATCNGIAGASQGSLTNADYTRLVSAVNTNNYINIEGNASGIIPLQIKTSTAESSSNTILSNFGVIDFDGFRAINVRRTFPNITAYTDVNFDFRNSVTSQPLYLNNVALSAFDIDYANSSGNTFDDFVKITGVTQSGNTIDSTFQPVNNSNIIFSQSLQGLLTRTINDPNCPAKNLGVQCQGSVRFSQPVRSVKIRYSNTGYLASTTNQEIDFRLDNYCYVPQQYTFSGTVFNDNGGITAAQADASNANINSGTYFNKPNYFNGIFNPPQESAITGSTVSLVNCATPSTVYGTQAVSSTGTFQISAAASTINANANNICLVEERTGTDYPIRTTPATKTIAIQPNTLNYPNNNFGRVIAANAALVLTKYQYINDCNIAAADYPTFATTNNPRTGFSIQPINNVEANECIAYKIVATNRANLIINNFVMTDVLQKKGVGNATATAIKVAPNFNATDYAADSVAIGYNGTVKTNALQLAARDKRDFYFNTQYDPLQ